MVFLSDLLQSTSRWAEGSPGISDMTAYLFEAGNLYVSGCDGNWTEAERKCAETRYLKTITDRPAGYGPHRPRCMYDTMLKKWVLGEESMIPARRLNTDIGITT
ncbi:hypothetical protein FRC03_012892 [Tulasnella sp. 419]|nr:hypothetical protein FRC03_012892 [Tulasnella sp. 419]